MDSVRAEGTRERNPNQRTIEVWMREHTAVDVRDRQQAVLAQLSQLKDEGVIAEFSVSTWPKHVATGSDGFQSDIAPALNKIRKFERWNTQNGTNLPGLQRDTKSSLISNSYQEMFTTPILSLAIYEDETLSEVVPQSGREGHCTVTEYLKSLTPSNDS